VFSPNLGIKTEAVKVSEFISIELKRAAIVLAEELDLTRAAAKLNMPAAEFRKQISALESQLYCQVFTLQMEKVELTNEGQFLIKAFRESVALHDRKVRQGPEDPQ
jgi:DNA-binding transcriptional LysR family regulator